MNERPSVTQAIRAVDAKTDVAIRLKACRAIMREAVQRCAELGVGCTVQGVEEIEFADRVEGALSDYLTCRSNPDARRPYVGATRGMDDIISGLSRIPASDQSQPQGEHNSEQRDAA
ncbi:MAG: hypothetical protein DI527_00415 [Chelatococcus sp.]|nr:MAG: hypothetical protein DI527_00415 [Chelatococcus sp.]